ncbi:hypothetical protein [Cupriavidus metallidurans]|uniref:hypothetical protein n=1 Tax=Cupriavidus metallidurans TaxID=119219 RepID=UPI001CCE73BD|nr:hypothetical protein [Cupriavidus metallidurans]UBM12770.1 hypothetical protein LAI70_27850 [Cupriavidus metallidurans]
MQLTEKQHKILFEIAKGNGKDSDGNLIPVDLDELLQRLDYGPSKDSMHFSIRALVRRGLIVKGDLQHRRGRMRVVYLPSLWVKNRFAQSPQPVSSAASNFDLADFT